MTTTDPRAGKRRSILDWFLLILAAILFACSLLTVMSAPTSWLWIVAILITEWGHYAAIVAALIAAIAWRRREKITTLLAVAAALLCFLPALRAATFNRSLGDKLTSAFGPLQGINGRAHPFDSGDLFFGLPHAAVDVTEHVYAQTDGQTLKLDLYRARGATAPEPIVIAVHGGSWKSGNRAQLPALNDYLAGERFAVAAIDYRHAPQFHSPAAVEDLFHAIDYLKAHAQELHLDATRIVLIGRSAGGQIALSAAYAGREPAIRGVVAFYAPTDLVVGYDNPSRRLVLDSKKVLEDYLGGSPTQNPAGYAAASPINFVNAQTPPTLLIHGQLDPMVWRKHSELLAAHLQQAGRPHFYLQIPWGTHGCDANPSGPSGQLSLYAIDRFLANVLHP
ncbi:MAG: alpha/beta hydrolase fold domain-containing protein [Chthoniobacterales bacterium]